MSKQPFFSVLIPTKNRAHLVGYAIESVLTQSFGDFEIIVADNDDGPATSDVMGHYDDERVIDVRTGGLDMIQNWGTALARASGRYVLLLEDKIIFYPDSFARLHRYIQEHPDAEALVWNNDVINDIGRQVRFKKVETERRIRDSQEVLEAYLVHRIKVWAQLPRGLCTAVSMEAIRRCETDFTGPFYDYFSPDLVSSLKVLRVTKNVHYIGDTLNCIISTSLSNGMHARLRSNDGSYYAGKAGLKSMMVEPEDMRVPVKSTFMVSNMVAHDTEITLIDRNRRQTDKTPYWQRYTREYFESVFLEVGSTVGKVGMVYQWRELRGMIRTNGLQIRPYLCFFRGLLHSLMIKTIMVMPAWVRSRAMKKNNSEEIRGNVDDFILGLIRAGRDL